MTVDDFIKAGYEKFSNQGINLSDFGLQKRVYDAAENTLYFINALVYSNHENKVFSFSVEVDFYHKAFSEKGYKLTHVSFSDGESVEEIEARVEQYYIRMNCIPDALNND